MCMVSLPCQRMRPAVTDPADVLFFDDDESNVDECVDAGFPHAPDYILIAP